MLCRKLFPQQQQLHLWCGCHWMILFQLPRGVPTTVTWYKKLELIIISELFLFKSVSPSVINSFLNNKQYYYNYMHHYDEALVWLVHIIRYIINIHETKTEKLIFSHLATSHFPCLKNPISHVISDDIKLLQLKEMHYQRRAVIELKYQTILLKECTSCRYLSLQSQKGFAARLILKQYQMHSQI